jgi:hypothetical protein
MADSHPAQYHFPTARAIGPSNGPPDLSQYPHLPLQELPKDKIAREYNQEFEDLRISYTNLIFDRRRIIHDA